MTVGGMGFIPERLLMMMMMMMMISHRITSSSKGCREHEHEDVVSWFYARGSVGGRAAGP